MGFDGLCRWVEWEKEVLGVFFFIRVGFYELCRLDKEVVFYPTGWDLKDCEAVICHSNEDIIMTW